MKKHPFLCLLGVISALFLQDLPAQDFDNQDVDRFCGFFTKIAHNALPSIVKVAALKRGKEDHKNQIAYGSGFFITPDGYVITSGHVVEAIRVSIYVESLEIEATLFKLITESDIAILKIDGLNLPYLPLGDSDVLQVGDWVISIGYPFSKIPFVAQGNIGAKDTLGKFLFTDILINPGNSGGPLLNLREK